MPQLRANCRITIRGSFNLNWCDYLGDMLADVQVEKGIIRSTTVIGHPSDLSAFLGTLHLLIDWGFPVTAFEYQQADPVEAAAGSRAEGVLSQRQPPTKMPGE
jgi:hypothetical protein